MSAGQDAPVFVEMEHSRKLFGPITGRSDVKWEDRQVAQGEN